MRTPIRSRVETSTPSGAALSALKPRPRRAPRGGQAPRTLRALA
jgi:hypothetical protein